VLGFRGLAVYLLFTDEEAVMSCFRWLVRALPWFAALLVLLPLKVQAVQRTFVSTAGSDSNTASNCSNTAPCRGFAAALTVTDSGGEIIVKDSGGYGPVTVSKSVSIVAPAGVYAGISVFSGDGVSITSAGADVTLRGLTILGLGGTSGIAMTVGGSLAVLDCFLSNLSYGINASAAVNLSVIGTVGTKNGAGVQLINGPTANITRSQFVRGSYGLLMQTTGAGISTTAAVDSTVLSGNSQDGIYLVVSAGNGRLDMKDSVASNNAYAGVEVHTSGGTIRASVSNSLISNNISYGIVANGPNTVLSASGNTVARNGTGLYQGGTATFESTGDNAVTNSITAPSGGTITGVSRM